MPRPTVPAATRTNGSLRQAAYRRRHLLDPGSLDAARLNMVVAIGSKLAIERLAKSYGVTQRVLVERQIAAAKQEATATMPRAEQKTYSAVGKQR